MHHDVYMRTTLTLDDDLADSLRERARLLGRPFKQIVNDTLRRGMSPAAREAPGRVQGCPPSQRPRSRRGPTEAEPTQRRAGGRGVRGAQHGVIVPDLNLLVYAYNDAAPHHDSARRWWEGLLNGEERVGVPWVVSTGFVRLMTHPRVIARPATPGDGG